MTAPEHPLAKAILRAQIVCEGERSRGRVRELTPGGRLLLDTRAPSEPGAPIRLWLKLSGSTHRLEGVVAGRDGDRLAAELRLSAADRDAVARLLVAADSGAPLDEVRVQVGRAPAPAPVPSAAPPEAVAQPAAPSGVDLARRWSEIRGVLDDAEAHAEFLGACARADRLDFAVACYRQLQSERPDDRRVRRYLQQAATVVSFAAMPPGARDGAFGSRRLRFMLGAFLAASAVLALIALAIALL